MAQSTFAYHTMIKPPPTADELPYEDNIPMESPKHRQQLNILIDLTIRHWHQRDDYYVGGNMFVYFSEAQIRNKDYRGPDFFIVKGDIDQTKKRKSWVVWEEEGRYPDLIIEFLPESVIDLDKTNKKLLYERTFKTHEYFCYNVFTEELMGWRLNLGKYQPILATPDGRMWSQTLNLWLGTGHGAVQRNSGTWLRFFDAEGNMISTLAEAVTTRAEQETARAEQEAARANLAEEKMAQVQAELDRLLKAE